ncbi:MAG: two-component regulator propeller domain-containing protein [Aestuariibaculum sp.]
MRDPRHIALKFKYTILILVSWSIAIPAFTQEHSNFINIMPELPKTIRYVNKIEQDSYGYIWMNYLSGYAKYDGYSYHLTKIDDIFKRVEKNDYITQIRKDYKNNIWIVSKNGQVAVCDTLGIHHEFESLSNISINIINTTNNSIFLGDKNGGIYTFDLNSSQLEKLSTVPNISPNIAEFVSIVENQKGNLYISTNNGIIYEFLPKENKLSPITGVFSNYPSALYLTVDTNNKLWIGSEGFGLFVYDTETKRFIQDQLFKPPLHNIEKELFISLIYDSKGFIWGGTDGGGLYRIDSNTGQILLFAHQSNNKFSLSSNTILDIFEDNHGNIWAATNFGGIDILPKRNNKIDYFEGSDDNSPSRILSIYKSSNGTLWAGTDGIGLTQITYNTNGTTTKKQFFKGNATKKGYYIQTITEDQQSNIWFGTYKNGLWQYNQKSNSFNAIETLNSKQQHATDVRQVFTDSKQRIWAATNLSLNVYSSNKKLLATFDNNTKGLKGHIIECIIEDTNGNIWVGSFRGGLFKFHEQSTNLNQSYFTRVSYYDEAQHPHDIPGLRHMSLDNKGSIWLISTHGKLFKVNPKTHDYQSFRNISTINDKDFKAVLPENSDNIWLSSSNGIIHFNIKDSLTTTLLDTDGLQGNVFLTRSAFKDLNGKLYFGGSNGLNSFYPNDITQKTSKARLHIYSMDILNKPAKTLIPNQITSNIENLKTLELSPNQSSFSFRFSAIDNILNPNYVYAYRLLGFNDDWITVTNEKLASYTNIPPGQYTFEVKAGTKKDVWDIPLKKIDITIAPPFWNTTPAYAIYALMALLVGLAIKKWYSLRKKLILDKINHNKEKELHAEKMKFFAKMSHEIQTPLTLISSPIDDMLSLAEKNGNLLLKQRLQIISNNVKRLSRIAFELTSLRDKELEKTRLFVTKNNLYKELHTIALSFKEQARFKNIDFAVNCPKNLSEAWYDKDKFEHIVYNLLANAFKFTPKEGNIQLSVYPLNNKNSIKIAISDSGSGISEEEKKNIFILFYQSKIGKKNKGTGIGLALTKELIDLHRGKIEVTSSASEGTTFTITIPIAKDAYLDEERIITNNYDNKPASSEDFQENTAIIPHNKHDKTILIVEDNIELQLFLKDLLSPIFNVILAENGNEGYYYTKSNYPDLIISDIMMPELDGINMCKKLQNDPLTKHIPIILLTAKNSTISKIEGLQSGAIEFINKPFNTNELILKIKNIIKSTEHIINNFKKESIQNPEIKITKSNDDIFLENLIAAINSRMENPNFKMEELADALNMSYSVLYRKCQSLTGEGLVDLVRLIRLKKAAIVIAKYGYSISEAAYLSGFNDPKYFSKCFKKQFNKTPNIFKKEAAEIGYKKYLKKYKLNDV